MRKQWQIISLSLRDLTATSDIRKRVFMWLLSVNESESSMWHRRTPLELDSTMRVHTYTNTMHTWPTEFWLLLIVKWCFSIQCCSWGNFAPNFNQKWCWMCIRDWITTQSIDSSTDRLLVVPRKNTHQTGPLHFFCCCSIHLELSNCWHSTVWKHSDFQTPLENPSVQTRVAFFVTAPLVWNTLPSGVADLGRSAPSGIAWGRIFLSRHHLNFFPSVLTGFYFVVSFAKCSWSKFYSTTL